MRVWYQFKFLRNSWSWLLNTEEGVDQHASPWVRRKNQASSLWKIRSFRLNNGNSKGARPIRRLCLSHWLIIRLRWDNLIQTVGPCLSSVFLMSVWELVCLLILGRGAVSWDSAPRSVFVVTQCLVFCCCAATQMPTRLHACWLTGLARLALHLLCLLLHLYVSISRATERLTHFLGWVSEGSLM